MKGKRNKNISVDFYIEKKERGRLYLVYVMILQATLLYLTIHGVIGLFLSALELSILFEKIRIYIIVCSIVFLILFNFYKYGKYILISGGGIYLFLVIKNIEKLKDGLLSIINVYISYYNVYMDLNLMRFPNKYVNAESIITTLIVYLMVPVLAVTSYVVIKNRNYLLYFIVTIPFILIPLTIGKIPDASYFFMYFFGTVGVISTARFDKQKENTKDKNNYGQVVVLMVLLVVIITSCTKIFPQSVYENQINIPEIKQSFQKRIENSGILNLATKFMLKNSAQGGIGEGRLGEVDSVKFKNNVIFEITMPNIINSLYVRSYVGSIYHSKGWSTTNVKDLEKYEAMLDSLKKEGFSPLNQAITFLDTVTKAGALFPSYITTDIIIKDIQENEKYKKVPYFLADSLDINSIQLERNPFENQEIPSLENKYSARFFIENNVTDRIFSKIINNYTLLQVDKDLVEKIIEKPIEEYDKKDEDFYYGKTIYESCQLYYEMYPDRNDLIVIESTEMFNHMVKKLKVYNHFLEQEKIYRDFVYKEYMELPIDSCEELISEWKNKYYYKSYMDEIRNGKYLSTIYDSTKKDKNKYSLRLVEYEINNRYIEVKNMKGIKLVNVEEVISYVKEYLKLNTKYSLNPGNTPNNKDFIEYFLTENKLGYCSYYATAATIMFRSMGIPARYVEGYVVTNSDIKNGIKTGSTFLASPVGMLLSDGLKSKIESPIVTASIKDTNAHAWTEIYMDGFGWIPVDVTPGYEDDGDVSLPNEIINPELQNTTNMNSNNTKNSPQINNNINDFPDNTKNITDKKDLISENEIIKEKDKKQNSENYKIKNKQQNINIVQTMFVSISVIILISFFAILIRFYYLSWKKKRKLLSKDVSSKIDLYYKDIQYMLGYWKMKDKNISEYSKYCKEVEEKLGLSEKGIFTEGFHVVVKSKFSQNEVKEEELKKVKKSYDCIYNALCFKINRYQILRLKYFRSIYPIIGDDNSSTSNIN